MTGHLTRGGLVAILALLAAAPRRNAFLRDLIPFLRRVRNR